MAASALSGMDAKAQTQRDAVYHIQTMYRGLTSVGTLQGLCRKYKEAKADSWRAAAVRGKPRVRFVGPPCAVYAPPPPHTMRCTTPMWSNPPPPTSTMHHHIPLSTPTPISNPGTLLWPLTPRVRTPPPPSSPQHIWCAVQHSCAVPPLLASNCTWLRSCSALCEPFLWNPIRHNPPGNSHGPPATPSSSCKSPATPLPPRAPASNAYATPK